MSAKGILICLMGSLTLAFLVVLPMIASSYFVSLALNILMWVVMAESWLLFSGYSGYISVGHGAFFGIGAYFMAAAHNVLPTAIVVLLSGALASGVALAIGFPVLRVRGPYFAILTLGLNEFAKYLFINYEVNVRGTVGRLLIGTPSLSILYYITLLISVIVIFTAYLIKISPFGMGLSSIREDEEAARASGVNTGLLKWLAFGLSAFFPGLVGATMALRWTYIDPYVVFNPASSFQITVMAFLGGTTAIHGPILGASILTLVSEALWSRYPNYYLILLGTVLILIVMFLPEGLVGIQRRLRPCGLHLKALMLRGRGNVKCSESN